MELLGYEIDPKYKEQILKQYKAKSKAGEKKKREEKSELAPWQDSNFYFIAGYTSGGAPYGITCEAYEIDIKEDNDDKKDDMNNKKDEINVDYDFLNGDIPF